MTGSASVIALASGGTGGHMFPAEALARELAALGHKLVWITDERGAERQGFLSNLETHTISARGLAGYGALGRITGAFSLGVGVFQARRLLKDMQPDAVVGFGGYAAAPTMMAATHLNLATVIHEQNAVIGRANRLFASRVDRICTTFESTRMIPDGVSPIQTGLPVRDAFNALHTQGYTAPLSKDQIRLFVIGGSQGAAVFSHLVPAALNRIPEDLRARIVVTQQCRAEIVDQTNLAFLACGIEVTLQPFFDNVPDLMADAHLVIARSGASTVNEVATAGRPALFIPYPYAADDHQTDNANAVVAAGGGWCEAQESLTPARLADRLETLLRSPNDLTAAAAGAKSFAILDAAARLADVIEDVIQGSNGGAAETLGAA